MAANVNGISGFVIAGAAKAVRERNARQESAAAAGLASAEAQAKNAKAVPQKPGRIDANNPTDWSKITGEL